MDIHIRELHTPEEILEAPNLEAAIWNSPEDTIRGGTLMAMVHEGALLAAAFVGDKPIGFVFGFPTHRNERIHSHMAGVLEEYRGTPAALLLKRYQRDWCLNRGYEQVVWTFDPMRGINASFNFRKLGVTFNEYLPNAYGMLGGINAGAPSDRAYVIWDLRSERVFQRIYAPAPIPDLTGLKQINVVENQVPLEANLSLDAPRLLLEIPEDWGDLLKSPEVANAWRNHSRQVFGHYFANGYRVIDFVRHPNRYLLEKTA